MSSRRPVTRDETSFGVGAAANREEERPTAEYADIARAAARLSTTPTALRARCRRAARREGRDIVARLGGGIVAIKLGSSWRVRFPE